VLNLLVAFIHQLIAIVEILVKIFLATVSQVAPTVPRIVRRSLVLLHSWAAVTPLFATLLEMVAISFSWMEPLLILAVSAMEMALAASIHSIPTIKWLLLVVS